MSTEIDWTVSVILPGNMEIVRHVTAREDKDPPMPKGNARDYIGALSSWAHQCGHGHFRIHLCVDPILIEVVRR